MRIKTILLPIFFVLFLLKTSYLFSNIAIQGTPESKEVDVLVYGATPSGIMAAYSVKNAGLSVVIVEPSRWVGGILGFVQDLD